MPPAPTGSSTDSEIVNVCDAHECPCSMFHDQMIILRRYEDDHRYAQTEDGTGVACIF